MSLPAYLNNINHSGIYRFIFDKSEVRESTNVETLRLVVGYSEKGPFNTPVLIRNESEFKEVFGGISKKLERYGCFFHRSALQCLKTGDAILALNIKPFTSESVEGVNFNIQESIANKVNLALNELYNTDRFWKLEPEHLENVESLQDKYITITTTDSKESSSNTIFVRGYLPKGYNITFKEYYSTMGIDMPTYVEGFEMEKLQNYFAEVYIFNGEFTPEIASSELLSKYFIVEGKSVKLRPYLLNAFGEKVDTLTALANNEASNFIRSYNGILLPDFQSTTGSIISLDSLVNADYGLHKCMVRLNQTMLFDNDEFTLPMISTTGWTVESGKGMMSLAKVEHTECLAKYIDGEWIYEGAEDSIFYTYDNTGVTMEEGQVILPEQFKQVSFKVGDSFLGNNNDVVTLTKVEEVGENVKCQFSGELLKETFIKKSYVVYDKESYERLLPKSYLSEHTWNANRPDGTPTDTQSTLPWLCIEFEKTKAKDLTFKVGGVAEKTINYNTETEVSLLTLDKEELGVQSMVGNWTIGINDEPEYAALGVESDGQVYKGTGKVVCTEGNTKVTLKKCVNSATITSSNLVPTYLKGYTYLNTKPASNKQMDKLKWQKQILNVLTEKGLRTALTNNVDISYKYLIDTFESFVEPECKSILALICKEKFNCLGILNVPSMKTFSTCDYTSYKDNKGNFNIEYIAKGGNIQKGVTSAFSLVSEENGASFVQYVTCLIVRDSVSGVKTTIPGAALISNEFMKKYISRYPYSVVAGPNYGRVTETGLISPDFNFGYDDLNVLEPMGINCYVYAPSKGIFINSQQTAKQNPVTALSKVHVRELCTFLQDEIEKMMQNYQWEFNNQRLRDEVRSKADVICETCLRNGGINAYKNICDSTNNTNSLIEREFFILETEIEPGFPAGKMVQKLTIHNNGTINAEISE